MDIKTIFFTLLGTSVLLLVVYDVYATIFHARARSGPVSETLNRLSWKAARFLAFRLARPRRHRLLNAVGPLLLPFLIVILIVLLVCGFALIYYPRMPIDFAVNGEMINRPWIDSLYFSGTTVLTVGYGDITPRTTGMRFVALVEAASGFAVISITITYLLSVYHALERKRAVALSFYHQAEEGADVAGFITHHFVVGRFYGLEAALRAATRDIQELLESHIEHPVIHYFHPVEVYKGLPRVLFLVLETCAVIRSCIDEEEYPETCNHPDVRSLSASARHVLRELIASLDLERRPKESIETGFEESRRWKKRYKATIERLIEAGIKTQGDPQSGWEKYRAQREEWEAQLHRFAVHLGYDWEEVTGDRDLRYAADEEMEQSEAEQVR